MSGEIEDIIRPLVAVFKHCSSDGFGHTVHSTNSHEDRRWHDGEDDDDLFSQLQLMLAFHHYILLARNEMTPYSSIQNTIMKPIVSIRNGLLYSDGNSRDHSGRIVKAVVTEEVATMTRGVEIASA